MSALPDQNAGRPAVPAIPRATVRLQFNRDFTFDHARALVPYFAALGVSHLYASPFLKARPGSTHGYDIVDHAAFNPEVGDEAAFDRMVQELHAHGMGLILDFVPNHMGVGGSDNPFWLDVLEWGAYSPYANFFDINWEAGGGKLVLPVLGDHYGAILERGELALKLDQAGFSVWYYTHRFPVALRDYPRLLRAVLAQLVDGQGRRRLAEIISRLDALKAGGRTADKLLPMRRQADELKGELWALAEAEGHVRHALDVALDRLNGTAGTPDSFRELHDLLERQAYRLAYWRVAADEINYRRFFDVNELAGLRMERPELFELAHRLVFRLIGDGRLQGLRIDHIDGLSDPKGYCDALQQRAAYLLDMQGGAAQGGATAPTPGLHLAQPLYLLVEKILARHERMREDWPVAGTTGYEFMVLVNGLFVDPAGEATLTQAYERFIEREAPYEEMLLTAKRLIIGRNLASELNVIARELHRLAQGNWSSRDYTLTGIRRALTEVVAHFPVYRTYITERQIAEDDRRFLDWAVERARKGAEAGVDLSVFDFMKAALSGDLARERRPGYKPADVWRTAMKFQQLTGPVMAKSLEDTLFYRYFRLVSLNEVGGDPDRFGATPSAFHHVNQDRLKRYPFQLLSTATHDHKRGADARVRIDVLSEMAEEWGRRARRWSRLNRLKKRDIDGLPAPGRNDEYLLYQTLVGCLPLELTGPEDPGLADFAERLLAYMLKAVRESKYRTSWSAPNADYESALERFLRGILDPARSPGFLADLFDFAARVGPAGAVNGLSQALLTWTAPGVPDLYQGTEFWDLSMVDPDNRRPPDWEARRRALEEGASPEALLEGWRDGRIKQHVVATCLRLRRDRPALFGRGDYVPLEASGKHAERVVAFLRRNGSQVAVAVAPRLAAPLLEGADRPLPPADAWEDTVLHLPDLPEGALTDLMTGEGVAVPEDRRLPLSALLRCFPVALLSGG
ncbi:MAG TPA: malto-oligosyltrehalose synthase [Azospirillaceae bacterium]|nr:malto-oligosyltrehalose synthase [Azospirillaceae bacterium]